MPGPGSAHGLGPHVVGQRVVVRRLLPGETGPSGGPAMTDVLGTLLAWDTATCVVAPESGPSVTIPLAQIVSGKPVPPRASVRQRVSVRDSESHARVLWPQVAREPLGEWELRTEPAPIGRPRKRANSCLALGDPGLPLQQAAEAVRDFYAARERPALVQTELDSETEHGLSALGWAVVPGGDAHLMLTSVAHALRSSPPPGTDETEGDGPRLRVLRRDGGQQVGTGEAALDHDWLGVHGLLVDPAHRGRGHASAIMATLLEWGAERGATTVWLHVETDNVQALGLYDRLGFRIHHTNRYLQAP
ncbi:MAG: GNAT family N-acetyltransferase [Nocardioides sp.]